MKARPVIPALLVSAVVIVFAPYASAEQDTSNYVAPAETSASQIVVTEARATEDELITRGVVDALTNDARLAGRIGVETSGGVVELTGIVMTSGQMLRAERDAKAVSGVLYVRNQLAARMGAGRY